MLGDEVDARHALVTALAPALRPEPRCSRSPCTRSCGRSSASAPRLEPHRRRSRSLSSESGAYHERRSPSGRFLPPDPRVREPYRLTPQLALRVGILGALALRRVRGPVPAALVAAGALGRRVPERGAEQPAPTRAHRGAARADPRPARPRRRLERRRDRGPAVGRRHAEAGPARARRAARGACSTSPRGRCRARWTSAEGIR